MKKRNLRKIDYLVLGLYLIIGFLIFIFYYQTLLPQKIINNCVLAFGFCFPFLLYGLYYKRFRDLKVITIWSFIAILQIGLYLTYKQNSDFISARGTSYLEYLIMLPILIITFSLLRFLYRLIFKKELIINVYNIRDREIGEEREVSDADLVFSIIGFVILIFGIHFVINLLN
ncbi:hypothetical protein ACH3O9_10945 [Leeuwenhoekiella sp. A16]|uniref:hypothetical protein n=1 Tax=unclassified Leeuwenhoekiella TaxID=2615029 RepID=UPI003A807E6E